MKINKGEKFDIIICGCGCAGFCAAVAAARLGMTAAVIDRYYAPGGILTVLGNNSIDQFNNPFIKGNKMIITGIGWEFVRRLQKDGFAVIPDMERPRTHIQQQVLVKKTALYSVGIIADKMPELRAEIQGASSEF